MAFGPTPPWGGRSNSGGALPSLHAHQSPPPRAPSEVNEHRFLLQRSVTPRCAEFSDVGVAGCVCNQCEHALTAAWPAVLGPETGVGRRLEVASSS